MKTGNPFVDALLNEAAKNASLNFDEKTGQIKEKIKNTSLDDIFGIIKSCNYKKSKVDLNSIYFITLDIPGIPKEFIKIKKLAPSYLLINGGEGDRTVNEKIDIGNDEIVSVKLDLGVLLITLKSNKESDSEIKID